MGVDISYTVLANMVAKNKNKDFGAAAKHL